MGDEMVVALIKAKNYEKYVSDIFWATKNICFCGIAFVFPFCLTALGKNVFLVFAYVIDPSRARRDI